MSTDKSEKKKIFQFRAFVSLLTAFSFIAAVLTGTVMFITPPGRVANWSGWTWWGFSKHEWSALHIWFALLFAVSCLFHIWFNFKPIVQYLKITSSKAYRFRFEWAAALAVCVIVFVGTQYRLKPFSSLIEYQDKIKYGWEDREPAGPEAHAELWTLKKLSQELEISEEVIRSRFSAEGIEPASFEITLEELSEQTGRTPNELYVIAAGGTKQQGRGSGGGFGQMTLREVCLEYGIEVESAVESLRQEGITAQADQTLRQIADQNGIHPSQIRQILSLNK